PLLQGPVRGGQPRVVTVVRGRDGLAGGRVDQPNPAAGGEAVGDLDAGVDEEVAALTGPVDDDVVAGADALLAQQRPDLVQEPDDLDAGPLPPGDGAGPGTASEARA